MNDEFREGVWVKPYERLDSAQIRRLHKASMDILDDPGFWCYNERAANLFKKNGAAVEEEKSAGASCWRVRLPAGLVEEAAGLAPNRVVLGARKPENRLMLDSEVPRVYFGSGSEANVWLETEMTEFEAVGGNGTRLSLPQFHERRGTVALLARAAHLCDQLSHLDFFIRPLNIQDPEITPENHDVNKFFTSLNNITKHVQAGLTSLSALPDVLRMAEIIAGGSEELKNNPVISFITCIFKSPLQMVDDTTDKVFAMVESGMPVVISSSPQGGSSAPIQEAGMVAQINAEIMAGITLTQLIRPGAPVLYGSVPVRARLDDLHDLYGCPEFNQYNIDCVQMARHYRIPCYSTAGVGDAQIPGMQASFEKMLTHVYMAMSGAQYIHYAFGLLDRTNRFCPLQAVLDDEQVGKIKHCLRSPKAGEADVADALKMTRKVMASPHRLYARHARKAMHSGDVSAPYAFESKEARDTVIERALEHMKKLESRPVDHLPEEIGSKIRSQIPGLI